MRVDEGRTRPNYYRGKNEGTCRGGEGGEELTFSDPGRVLRYYKYSTFWL